MGIGDWANPQSPIPNPQSPIPSQNIKYILIFSKTFFDKILIKFYKIKYK